MSFSNVMSCSKATKPGDAISPMTLIIFLGVFESLFTKIKIVTDDPECETVRKLISEGCELATSGPPSHSGPWTRSR